jgi:hypothetical protein
MRWFIGVTVACGTAAEETPCADLDEAGCAARADCAAVNGAPIAVETTASGSCYAPAGDTAFGGCREDTGECPPTVRFAAPEAGGECWQFPAGCAPDGWVACEAVGPCLL